MFRIYFFQNQGTPEQLEEWMPLIKNYKIIGTYAQTEMGHGMNSKKINTIEICFVCILEE